VIVDKALYRRGVRQACGDLSDELGELADAGEPGDFLWVGLKDPTTEEFHDVNEELGLHPLAIEDAVTGRQRVKFERCGAMSPWSPPTLALHQATSDIESGELIVMSVIDSSSPSVVAGDAFGRRQAALEQANCSPGVSGACTPSSTGSSTNTD
jgi:hypothetical protein